MKAQGTGANLQRSLLWVNCLWMDVFIEYIFIMSEVDTCHCSTSASIDVVYHKSNVYRISYIRKTKLALR